MIVKVSLIFLIVLTFMSFYLLLYLLHYFILAMSDL